MSVHGLYLDINKGKKKNNIYTPLEINFYFFVSYQIVTWYNLFIAH